MTVLVSYHCMKSSFQRKSHHRKSQVISHTKAQKGPYWHSPKMSSLQIGLAFYGGLYLFLYSLHLGELPYRCPTRCKTEKPEKLNLCVIISVWPYNKESCPSLSLFSYLLYSQSCITVIQEVKVGHSGWVMRAVHKSTVL